MIDTHAHLNFKRFKKTLHSVIEDAKNAYISDIIVPGTDIISSKRAIEIAASFDNIYAAVGIHPHHVYEYLKHDNQSELLEKDLHQLKILAQKPNVVAIGEVGLDKHTYGKTKYYDYKVDNDFLNLQKYLLSKQITLAISCDTSLILHNREASDDILELLESEWTSQLAYKAVFHCCEANEALLSFAKEHNVYIGVDGDITYEIKKQNFIKKIPLELLVLETDSPFLLPEPLKSQKMYPNEPKNLELIAKQIAEVKHISVTEVKDQTTANAKRLFGLT